MKYLLVEVTKQFGIYPMKAQIVMRKNLAEGIFKDKVKVLKKLSDTEALENQATKVKYQVEEVEEAKETEKVIVDNADKNIIAQNGELEEEDEEIEEVQEEMETVETGVVEVEEKKEEEITTEDLPEEETIEVPTLEEMETVDLLEMARKEYGLNKPDNTGRKNLIDSITEARNK